MTAGSLRKYKTFLYDDKGKPVMVQLDLRNKLIKHAYERAMEELEDMLDIAEAEQRIEDGSKSRPFEEFAKENYARVSNG
jgi:hypothetical protein